MIELHRTLQPIRASALTALCALAFAGCSTTQPDRPNVLWVVWDTVRADRMSVYGYDRPTTPFLEQWAAGSRVFDDCVATAGSTVPSHASMFTGLLPTEHGANYSNQKLADRFDTIAELFQGNGYETFLFAANPHIQVTTNFGQGFETQQHPWNEQYRDEAISIVRGKIPPGDQSSHLVRKLQSEAPEIGEWNLMASGQLAERALLGWLDERDPSKPYFAFLNYMEAHAPYVPPRSFRERIMDSDADVERSYTLDNRAVSRWAYCFNLHEYSPEELDRLGAVYDSTLLELDELFRSLLGRLEDEGHLDDTIVVLVSDHGEQLGEHHLIDHQYALYDAMLRVPLIVHYPQRFAPGRDDSAVSTFDLFPTLLELAGIDPPAGLESKAVSLLAPEQDRARLAEYPTPFEQGFKKVLRFHPEFDPSPWSRRLRAFYQNGDKLICSTDGQHQLYDRSADPAESANLFESRPERSEELMRQMLEYGASLAPPPAPDEAQFSEEELAMLRAIGYVGGEEDDDDLALEIHDAASCGFE